MKEGSLPLLLKYAKKKPCARQAKRFFTFCEDSIYLETRVVLLLPRVAAMKLLNTMFKSHQ